MVFKSKQFAKIRLQNQAFLEAFRAEKHPLALFLRQRVFSESTSFRVYVRACKFAARALNMAEADVGDLLSGGLLPKRLDTAGLQVIREAGERELADQLLHMEKDMATLATITSLAPFMGLFGTVWGVMEAFNGMAVTGAPTLSSVAPGISSALLTTVVGLLVAMPTVFGYNLLSVRLREEAVRMDNFLQEWMGEMHHTYAVEE
jgi:biopolymer transport protein ExbB/TolQ